MSVFFQKVCCFKSFFCVHFPPQVVDEHNSHPCAQPLFQLGPDQIACFAEIPRWYHDHAGGDCKPFKYDGCNQNANNFESKEDCDKICAEWHKEHKDHQHGGHSHESHAEHEHDCKDHEHGRSHKGYKHEHGHTDAGHEHAHHHHH